MKTVLLKTVVVIDGVEHVTTQEDYSLFIEQATQSGLIESDEDIVEWVEEHSNS